jgi:predicted membrane-bound spermidine synthase
VENEGEAMSKLWTKEHNQKVARALHEKGIEITPDQVKQERLKAFDKIRKVLKEAGFPVPKTDVELIMLVKQVLREEKP